MAGHAPRPHCLWTTVADGYTIEVDTNGERDKARLIGMDTPGTPEASVVVSYQHCPACCVQQLGQTGFSFSRAGFGFVGPGSVRALGSRHPTWTGSAKSV